MKEIQLFSSAIDSKSRTRTARAFGIDLGTTNSSVAEASWASGEKPVCGFLEIDQPLWPAGTMMSSLVPSVVAVLDSDGLMIGEVQNDCALDPRRPTCFRKGTCFTKPRMKHLGLLEREEYKRHWDIKKAWYEKHFSGRLVKTEESGNLSIEASKLIEDKFS